MDTQQQIPTLQFQPDVPVNVVFLYDTPKTGVGQYGQWFLYSVQVNGQNFKFFAPQRLHQKIVKAGLKAGSQATITLRAKLNAQGRPYKDYELSVNGNLMELTTQDLAKPPTPIQTQQPRISQKEVDWDKISRGKVRHNFALEAYKSGKKLNNDLVNEIEEWVDYVMTGELKQQLEPDNDLPTINVDEVFPDQPDQMNKQPLSEQPPVSNEIKAEDIPM